MTTVADVTEELVERREEYGELLDRQAQERTEAEREIRELEQRQAHLAAGTTEDELRFARGLIEVSGRFTELDEQVIREAVEDIAAGCLTLRSEYFCRRVYEGHVHRETYEYGFGPKHGHAVFRIGLTQQARDFIKRWRVVPLGLEGDVGHAAIRYLLNLKEAGQP